MGKLFLDYLNTSHIYTCKTCGVHLSNQTELMSKDFWAGSGKAYLYNAVSNVYNGIAEERMLRTGLHSVCDIFCKSCNIKIGWKYEWALEQDQKYKEGKFILERNLISKIEWD